MKGNPDRILAVPFQVTGLVGALVAGVAVFVTRETPNSIVATLPVWAGVVWTFALTLGSATALAGVFWRWDPEDALLVEEIGLVAAGGASLVYACALAANIASAVAPVYLIGGFGVACCWRAMQIHLGFRRAVKQNRSTGNR